MKRVFLTILLATALLAQTTPKVHVRKYTRKDGTPVSAHDRSAPTKKSPAKKSTKSKSPAK